MKKTDMDYQIHCIETEAYGAVLRAFIAQSDVLTWDKEELITELRKELRVSDAEHREILVKINQDESIKSVRARCKGTNDQQLSVMNPLASDSMFVAHVSRKKLKPAQAPVAYFPQFAPSVQPSPSPMHVRDGHRNSNTAVFCPHSGQPFMPLLQNGQAPSSGNIRGSLIVQASRKGVHSDSGNMKAVSDIKIRRTDKVINEIIPSILGQSSIHIPMKNEIGAGSHMVLALLWTMQQEQEVSPFIFKQIVLFKLATHCS